MTATHGEDAPPKFKHGDGSRTTEAQEVTRVNYTCRPYGRDRTNPPSLGQLREFIAVCEDMPDDTTVTIEKGSLDESGRYSYILRVRRAVDIGASDG